MNALSPLGMVSETPSSNQSATDCPSGGLEDQKDYFVEKDGQKFALQRAGFVDIQLRYEEGNMALWRETNETMPRGTYSR